jgi:quercetin dioxygenase-like cupin family protein
MVGGLALAASAAAILVLHLDNGAAGQAEVSASSELGFPLVGTASDTYRPGHSSGWHVHPGLHSVVVLGGTLTVYDESCAPTTFGAGETYLGGSTPHLARNETGDVLDVAITYIYEGAASGDYGHRVPPPKGCELS